MSNQNNSPPRSANMAMLESDRLNELGLRLNWNLGGNTKRERLNEEFGYPKYLTFILCYLAWRRCALANAAVERMVEGCWVDYPEIFEGDKSKDAEALTDWDKTVARLLKKQWQAIRGADRRNLVGRYSALYIQFKDNLDPSQPVDRNTVKLQGENAIAKLVPLWEEQIYPTAWNTNETSEKFGEPSMYEIIQIPLDNQRIPEPGRVMPVHPERVIIFAEGSDDGQLASGRSLLEAGMNRLFDLDKVTGGSAEGYLKNASRQISFMFDDKTNFAKLAAALGTDLDGLADALDAQVKRLNRNTDSASFMQAGKAEILSVPHSDPKSTWEILVSEFAATVPIPVKVLVGMQTGERASTEDAKEWAKTRMSRRNGFLSDRLTALLTHYWELGVINEPVNGEITIVWSDLLAPSELEKIELMKALAEVADISVDAYGVPVIKPNEIRAAGQLPTDPQLEDLENDEQDDKQRRDPFDDDGDDELDQE